RLTRRSPVFPYTPLFRSLVALGQPVAGDPIGLERLRPDARLGLPVGPAPPLGRRRVEQVLQLGQVAQTEQLLRDVRLLALALDGDRKSTRLNSSHLVISY